MPICFKRLHDKAFLPSRGSPCAAGLDLYTDVGFFMSPGVICKIGTGVAAELRESLDETLQRLDAAMSVLGANDGRP